MGKQAGEGSKGQVGAQELRKKEQRDSQEAAKGAAALPHPEAGDAGCAGESREGCNWKRRFGRTPNAGCVETGCYDVLSGFLIMLTLLLNCPMLPVCRAC